MTYQIFGCLNARPDVPSDLRESREEIGNLEREIAFASRALEPAAGRIEHAAADGLRRLTCRASASFGGLAAQRVAACEPLRGFIVDNGLKRPVRKPDLFSTIMVTQGALLVEAFAASVLLIAGGKTGLYEGIGYGLTFAALTVGTGLATGFFACRWICYRRDAPYPRLRDLTVRIAGWCGFGTGLGVIGGLGLAAARVRATGSHLDIWNFETVSLAATFSDYFSLAIPVVALLAIYKGIGGIKDPYPGYQEAQEAAEARILEAAETLHEDLRETAEALRDDALEALEEDFEAVATGRAQSRADILERAWRAASHNSAVEAARAQARKWAEEERARTVFVSRRGEVSEPLAFDESAFDALLVPDAPPDEPDGPGPEDPDIAAHLAVIEATCAEALGKIGDAYAAFLSEASVPPMQVKENNHGS